MHLHFANTILAKRNGDFFNKEIAPPPPELIFPKLKLT